MRSLTRFLPLSLAARWVVRRRSRWFWTELWSSPNWNVKDFRSPRTSSPRWRNWRAAYRSRRSITVRLRWDARSCKAETTSESDDCNISSNSYRISIRHYEDEFINGGRRRIPSDAQFGHVEIRSNRRNSLPPITSIHLHAFFYGRNRNTRWGGTKTCSTPLCSFTYKRYWYNHSIKRLDGGYKWRYRSDFTISTPFQSYTQ